MIDPPPRLFHRRFSASYVKRNSQKSLGSCSEVDRDPPMKFKQAKSIKSVRFSTVRSTSFKAKGKFKDLWWSDDELRKIRADAQALALHVRADRPLQDQALEILSGSFKGSVSEKMIAASMKMLENTSIARGLERHTSNFLKTHLGSHQMRVLEAQEGVRSHKSAKREMHLKSVSSRSSKCSAQLAFRLAMLDYRAVYQETKGRERLSESFTNRSSSSRPKQERRLSSFW